MPAAFDRKTPLSEHNPLTKNLDYNPAKNPLDIATLLDTWLHSIEEFIFPIVLELTGIDLSSPEAFFSSIALLIINGGTSVLEFIRSVLSPLVNILVTALNSIPFIGEPLGNALTDLAALFGLMNSRDVVQQASADTANVGLAILNARVNGIIVGGATLYDTFDRDVADINTDPAYDVAYLNGPGSMGLSSSSSGIAFWNAVGYSDASFIARDVTTPMTTNHVRVSMVISDFIYGSAGNQATARIAGRMSADKLNYVVAIIQINWAEIGYVVGGTYTRLGSQEAVTVSSGDLWDLEIGEPGPSGDEWQFTLKQNNAVRVSRNDLGHASMKDTTPGTTYKWVAFAGDCAIGYAPFFVTYQIGMPNFQVLAAADY